MIAQFLLLLSILQRLLNILGVTLLSFSLMTQRNTKKDSLWVIRKILVRMFPWGWWTPCAVQNKKGSIGYILYKEFSYFSKIAFTSIGYIFAQMKLLYVDQQTSFAFRKLYFDRLLSPTILFSIHRRKVQIKLSFV